jgi:GntR family transcriptional regulator/MocR family aminotransferase
VVLSISVDPGADAPLHRQVYDGIRGAILSGSLQPGERLPPTRVLAGQLSLSRVTVAEAYDQLQTEGYVQGKRGSGTYVAPDIARETLPDARPVGVPAQSVSLPELSPWGRRIAASHEPREAIDAHWDLRPHRIADDLFPWDAWSDATDAALASHRDALSVAPDAAGLPLLRRAIAQHVERYRAVACSPEQIVVVTGSQQGLNLLAQLLLAPGDRVAVEDPGYPAAMLALEVHGAIISRIPVDEDGLAIDALSETGPQRLVYVTPSHQHPTGATLSLTRRLALLDLARREGTIIVEDDYDSEFRYEGSPIESLQGLDRSGLVIYAGTFSKSVLSGLRIGFVVLPERLVAPFTAAKSLWDGGTPMLEQAVLAEFMRSGGFERHVRRMRRIYRSRRDAFREALAVSFGERASVGLCHGGLTALVELESERSTEEIVRRARDSGLALRAATRYFADPPPRPSFLVGFGGLAEDRAADAMAAFAAAAQ